MSMIIAPCSAGNIGDCGHTLADHPITQGGAIAMPITRSRRAVPSTRARRVPGRRIALALGVYALLAVGFTPSASGEPTPDGADKTVVFKTVEGGDRKLFAVSESFPGLRLPLRQDGPGTPQSPREFRTAPGHDHVGMLIYFSGEPGTHALVEVYRAVLFDCRTGDILGDHPYAYKADSYSDFAQPSWTWRADSVVIDDPDIRKVVIDLPAADKDADCD